MPKHFRDWRDQDDARRAVAADIEIHVGEEGYRANYLYIEKDDHWQEGKAYAAYHADRAILTQIRAEAQAYFTPVPTAKECVEAEVDALVETEALVSFSALEPAEPGTPAAEEQAREADKLMGWVNDWWDPAGFWPAVRAAVRYSTWAGRGGLRRRLLPSAWDKVERNDLTVYVLRDGLEPAQALAQVHVTAPLPDQVLLYTDENTQEQCVVVLFQHGDGSVKLPAAEVWFADRIEQTPVTVRRILVTGATDYTEETFPQMAGRLPLEEMRAEILMTEPVRLQQRRRDFAETQLGRTAQSAAVRERYTTNIDPPAMWTRTPPDGPPIKAPWTNPETGEVWYPHPVPAQIGGGIRNDLQGRTYSTTVGDETKQVVMDPTVVIADPVDTRLVTHACDHARSTILETCHQLHALEGDKGAESGYSKRQSRARFEKRVGRKKQTTEVLIANSIDGVLADAALLAPGSEFADLVSRYRANVTLHVDTGPLDAEEEESERKSVAALMKPRGDAMTALGNEDTKKAHEAIMADPIQRLIYRKLQAEVYGLFVQDGTVEGALAAAEIDGELAEKLRAIDAGGGAL